jgi:KaiC/GvpD/RAD55 family RecA-like ATPase
MEPSSLLHTGIPGLDTLLGGGFPPGRVIILLGEPGTGKTIISTQFLFASAFDGQGVSMFIGLNESKSRIIDDMKSLGMDFSELEKNGRFVYVDAMSARRASDLARTDTSLVDTIREAIQEYSPKRIALDSISDLIFRYPRAEDRLPVILDLIETLQSSKATSLLTVEVLSRGDNGSIQPEEYLADGILLLKTGEKGARSLQILKMRGAKIETKPKPYEIKETGVEIYANEDFF